MDTEAPTTWHSSQEQQGPIALLKSKHENIPSFTIICEIHLLLRGYGQVLLFKPIVWGYKITTPHIRFHKMRSLVCYFTMDTHYIHQSEPGLKVEVGNGKKSTINFQ